MAIYRITRTSSPNLAPASGTLVPGQLAVEMATQPNPRLWVGVPTTIDPTGRRLIVNSTGGGGGGGGIPDAPTDGAIYGRDGETETWVPVLPLTGGANGTMQGPLILNGNASQAEQALPLGQVAGFLGFPVQGTAPSNPNEGQLWFNTNTGQLEEWNGTAWVPATAGFLSISGGTMLGNLILDGPPSEAGNINQAATRGYVDERITGSVQFIGTLDAQSGTVQYTASSGIASTVLVDPTTVKDTYVIVSVSGTMPSTSPYLPGVQMQVGDWVISDGTAYFLILVSGEVVLASEVSVTPPVLGATDAQTALEALLANFSLYAPLASPSLQGIPTTPTPPIADHSLQVANTSWVQAAIATALLTPGGNVDNVLMIGDITGAESIAGSGDFFDQLSLSGDSSGISNSTLPNYITSVELQGDAANL